MNEIKTGDIVEVWVDCPECQGDGIDYVSPENYRGTDEEECKSCNKGKVLMTGELRRKV